LGGEAFPWPQGLSGEPVPPEDKSAYVATMINADKRSAVGQAQYRLRRKVVSEARRRGIPLGVAGPGWNSGVVGSSRAAALAVSRALVARRRPNVVEAFFPLVVSPTHYLGPVRNKFEFLAMSDLSVVIENSPDYVSEKLVDTLLAGAVPVYVGPRLADFGIPEGLVVRSQPSADEVIDAVLRTSPKEVKRRRELAREWLATPDFAERLHSQVYRRLGTRVRMLLNRIKVDDSAA
jgi:hypothetical protein